MLKGPTTTAVTPNPTTGEIQIVLVHVSVAKSAISKLEHLADASQVLIKKIIDIY